MSASFERLEAADRYRVCGDGWEATVEYRLDPATDLWNIMVLDYELQTAAYFATDREVTTRDIAVVANLLISDGSVSAERLVWIDTGQRVVAAQTTIEASSELIESDISEEAVRDGLVDLRYICDIRGFDFGALDSRAYEIYILENSEAMNNPPPDHAVTTTVGVRRDGSNAVAITCSCGWKFTATSTGDAETAIAEHVVNAAAREGDSHAS